VLEREQLLLCTAPSLEDTVGVPHALVAVAVPRAPFMSAVDGLHPSDRVVPPVTRDEVLTPELHLTVRDIVAVLPQASLAVKVLVCELLHPLLTTAPSVEVKVGVPQASVALAVPSEPAGAVGLQPSI